ncbi:MAG TPA: M20/M25/M40 family metallo-hydrolase [Bryobacteraceae bacterium]|nr:M20/M25/M40 family metallo-hydrolase [Bryobacteraceae bacterium]
MRLPALLTPSVCLSLLLPAMLPAILAAADLAEEGKRWWSHIQVLADDKMEGRNTGSEGHKRAAQYVAGEFERNGLKPAGTSGYIQPVKFNVTQIVEASSSLAVVRRGAATQLKLGDDATFTVRGGLAPQIDAPAVFAGHGLVIPENNIDDFAGLDLKGKIVVYITGGPTSVPSALKAHYSSRGERWKAIQKTGAIGIAEIPNPKSMDVPWARATLARNSPTMALADPKLEEVQGMKFAVRINPDRAEKLFAGSGHSFSDLLALSDTDKPLPKFPLNRNFRARLSIKNSEVESQNVVGLLPGTDPKLKDEFVVFSSHLDHLGVGQPINGDKVYNGAMDDGSGVATLIEIATMMKQQKVRLKRSVIFLTVTAEEKGLLGSRYFTTNPTVPKESIVADINVDMFLPLFPLKFLEVQGLTESSLGEQIRAACQKANVTVQADKEPDRNLFIRSDQYNFIRQGIPALAFKFGYEKGSNEERIAKDWLKNRYHAPADDLEQPVDMAAAARFDRILLDLGEHVANAKDRPQWNPDSFFRRFAAGE